MDFLELLLQKHSPSHTNFIYKEEIKLLFAVSINPQAQLLLLTLKNVLTFQIYYL